MRELVDEAHDRYASMTEGRNADYIPALASAPSSLFGICIAGANGDVYAVGDAEVEFSIQSVSKPFAFALVCNALGAEAARARLGVNATGLPFNSVMAIELHEARTINPLVNAGAIATTSLAPGSTTEAKWRFLHDGLSRFAGRDLTFDEEIYSVGGRLQSAKPGHRPPPRELRPDRLRPARGDRHLHAAMCAEGHGPRSRHHGCDPCRRWREPDDEGAVVDPVTCQRTLAVMATAGLYESSGDWLYDIGLPGKSGVGGGIVTVAPGKGGLGTFSPPLDEAGNSVRGQHAARFLSERLGLNLFASVPV